VLWGVLAGIAALFLSHTAPFPFLLDRFAPVGSIWHMPSDPRSPTIYLTFDDGPNPNATPMLLDALRDRGARATFFLIDAHLTTETVPIVQRMFADGHAVALHSDTRALMAMSSTRLAETLQRQADRITQLAGTTPCRLFRPHAGWRSASMYAGLTQIDHRLVGWSFGLWDFNWYRRPNPVSLAERLARRASAGDIIVMHDGHHVDPRADRAHTIEAVRELVPRLRSRGFSFGALCEPAS
jgi:peptidoglycan-N-acetylglucosamine deacetylase